MKATKIFSLIMVLALLSSCNQDGTVSKQNAGTILGGVGGALLGSQVGGGSGRIAGAAVGALAGAYLGNQIGASLDKADRMYYERATTNTLETVPTGRTKTWRNPDSGNWGTVTATKTYQANNGEYCREFTQKITVAGKVQQGYGTACRQPDGTWKVISNN
jgi:surface antigen